MKDKCQLCVAYTRGFPLWPERALCCPLWPVRQITPTAQRFSTVVVVSVFLSVLGSNEPFQLGSLERREEDTTLKPDKGQIYPLSEVFSDTTFVEEKRLHRLGLSG